MTNNNNLARNISLLRKERKLTQDQLAEYLGVTKASVSKWETGQSYPDFPLLPQIATYFGVTVDQLIGYEPQLSKERIRTECAALRSAFATKDFDSTLAACHRLVHDYYSCYPLLAQMASLYVNHLDKAPTDEARAQLIAEALELCSRVREHSTIPADIKMVNALEASLLLMQGKATDAVTLLENTITPEVGDTIILASAYSMIGQPGKAQAVHQSTLLQSLAVCVNTLAIMGMESVADPQRLAIIHQRTRALMDAFDFDHVYLNSAACHLQFAQAFAQAGQTDQAFTCLNDYVRACRALEFPLRLHGDAFFDHLDEWAETLTSGDAAPRSDQAVKESLVTSVKDNPLLATLADDPRFACVLANLEDLLR